MAEVAEAAEAEARAVGRTEDARAAPGAAPGLAPVEVEAEASGKSGKGGRRAATSNTVGGGGGKRGATTKGAGGGGGGGSEVGRGETGEGDEGSSAHVEKAKERLGEQLASSLTRVSELFESWDVDGNGLIDRVEFRRAMVELELYVPDHNSATRSLRRVRLDARTYVLLTYSLT